MFIKSLKLTNFRNFSEAQFEFTPENNLIYGCNGSGKTNLLEALFYCGTGRSFRTHFDENLINNQSDYFRVEAEGQIGEHEITVGIGVKPGSAKNIKINSAPVKRIGQLFEYFRLIEFSPYDLEIINGAPSLRRRFISLTISQSEPSHIALLSEYMKIISQRNALLKRYQEKEHLNSQDEAMLSVWDDKLSETAVAIHNKRQTYITTISELAQKYYLSITRSQETFQLEYAPSPRLDEYTKENLMEKLVSRRHRELALGQSLYGIHRDDLKISIKGLEARSYASQGQIKTAVLSLKLAQYEYLKEKLGNLPILLFDEIFSDLDANRLEYILNLLPSLGQVFVTTSKLKEINDISIFNCKYNVETNPPSLLK